MSLLPAFLATSFALGSIYSYLLIFAGDTIKGTVGLSFSILGFACMFMEDHDER